jgi:MoaA/NifB/PqqE/SkfB family radical SAM enzyme
MTKEVFMKRWKKSEKWTQVQKSLIFDCIHAEEIVHIAYKLGFIKWNVYNLVMERIKRTRNGSWMLIKSDKVKAYEKLIEKKYHESLMENQKSMHYHLWGAE